jgi:DNA processing protein
MHERVCQIALALTTGIGPVRARSLVARFGTAENIFRTPRKELARVPDVGPASAAALADKHLMTRAEAEFRFAEEAQLSLIFLNEPAYPDRLRLCADAPVLLYTRGRMDLNSTRIISIVGTRTATSYGKQFCEELVAAVAPYSPLVVSGLAYGIDICAHRACISRKVATVACMAHGHDRIYPMMHASVAQKMMERGGLVTEFPSGTRPDRELFPMRNRIIAGMSDCTVVVETDERGGSMITAHFAHGYGREVYALPGRYHDLHSRGCNQLIRRNVAGILTRPEDLVDELGWTAPADKAGNQVSLFDSPATPEEKALIAALRIHGEAHLDDIVLASGLGSGAACAALLDLEFRGIIRTLPGKRFTLQTKGHR